MRDDGPDRDDTWASALDLAFVRDAPVREVPARDRALLRRLSATPSPAGGTIGG